MPYRAEDGTIRPGRRRLPVIPRLVEGSTIMGPDECWEWNGVRLVWGYGHISVAGHMQPTHRAAFAILVGPIPEGKRILHSCDNPPCWNPAHLRAGTDADNMRDQLERGRHPNVLKTHCPQGHPYSGDNLYRRKDGARSCIACTLERTRQRRARLREARPPKPPREVCAQGHSWAAYGHRDATGAPRCRECTNERQRKSRARKTNLRGE